MNLAVLRKALRPARYAAVALLAGSLLGVPPAAATPTTAVARAAPQFLLRNVNSGLCLTLAGGSTALNQTAVQYYCDTHVSRRWSLVNIGGSNRWFIRNRNSGLCLTIAGGSKALNQVAVQYRCDTHPSRQWRFLRTGRGTNKIVNVNSGLCLTIAGGSTGLNVAAVQYRCDSDLSRTWTLAVA